MKFSAPRAGNVPRRVSVPGRTAAALALSGLLSACAIAPGFRMPVTTDEPANQTQDSVGTTGSHTAATAATPAIPVTELDFALVRKLAVEHSDQRDSHAQRLFDAPGAYTVGVGDVLQIVVWDHPEFAAALGSSQGQASSKASDPAAGFVVDQNGNLHFPYAGALAVRGLRTDQIQERLAGALSKYLVKPQVTVRVASYRSRQVYVDGEVRNPGTLSLTDVPMNLYDAIALAGGFSENADQSDVVLIRAGVMQRIDVPDLIAHGLNPSRMYLKAGDLLRVAPREDNGVYVMGEVNKPGSAVPRRDGRLTLADALSQAGSINSSTADTAQMFVIRSRKGEAQVYHLDSRSPVSMLVAKEFELQPKDIVYVDGSGLVRFNRVMTLLLPLINTGLTAGVIAK